MERRSVEIGCIYRHNNGHYVKVTDIAKMRGNPEASMVVYNNMTTGISWTIFEYDFILDDYCYKRIDTRGEFDQAAREILMEMINVTANNIIISEEQSYYIIEQTLRIFHDIESAVYNDNNRLRYCDEIQSVGQLISANRILRMYDVPYTMINIGTSIFSKDVGRFIRVYRGDTEKDIMNVFINDFMESVNQIKESHPKSVYPKVISSSLTDIVIMIMRSFGFTIKDCFTIADAYRYIEKSLTVNNEPVIDICNILSNNIETFGRIMYNSMLLNIDTLCSTTSTLVKYNNKLGPIDIISKYIGSLTNVSLNVYNANVLIDLFNLYGISICKPHEDRSQVVSYLNELLQNLYLDRYEFKCDESNNKLIVLTSKLLYNAHINTTLSRFTDWISKMMGGCYNE